MRSTTASQKAVLRSALLKHRCALPAASVAQWSAAIAKRLQALSPFTASPQLLSYVGSKDNEVATLPLLAEELRRRKSVLIPRVQGPGLMQWVAITHLDELQPGRWGLLEPIPGVNAVIATEELSPEGCCLVPGIAFTADGHRVGYGGGYFDRFLADYPGLRVGLCFEAMLQPELPFEIHDQPVDWVITEKRSLSCRNT